MQPMDGSRDRRGVAAAREQNAHRDIAAETNLHGVQKGLPDLFDERRFVLRCARWRQLPEALRFDPSRYEVERGADEKVTGGQLADSTEEGVGTDIEQGLLQVGLRHRSIDAEFLRTSGQNRLDLG